jgi:methylmalonyl-CoA mutase cobalamin-binding subunit/DNA-binding transcriptional MerR regulator
MVPQNDRNADPGVAIAELSRVLGVPMPTLRSWELRYGIPTISRPRGQHRRYLAAEIHAVRLMRDEIVRGLPAAAAAQSVRDVLNPQGPAGVFITRILDRSQQFDTVAIRSCLDEARSALGLGACIDEVLLPALRQVGIWWEIGHCDVVQERITTEAVRAWLDQASAFAPVPRRPPRILLACGPSDLHTVGLESLALILREAGFPCRVLGARTPTITLVTAAQAMNVSAVVVVSHLATGRVRAVASIAAISRIGVKVFFAGNAFSSPRGRKSVPGTYLGVRMQDACTLIETSLSPVEFPPSAIAS